MKEYIERRKLKARLVNLEPPDFSQFYRPDDCYLYYMGFQEALKEVIEILESQPTVDTQKVVYGKWLNNPEDVYWGNYHIRKQCSICGAVPEYSKNKERYILGNYCRNCGAKME